MSDIEVYTPTQQAALPVLDRSEMNALFKLAKALSDTSFAPQVFRGKPWECLAAILTGRELGIGPMESLTQIHVIQGRPTLSAQLMRALVYRRGHSINVIESTDEFCTVLGTRKDTGDKHEVTFTMKDAQAAGLVTKRGPWETYRRSMLAARATSALCRELFPDCLAGAAYVPEEMGGEPAAEDVAGPPEVVTTEAAVIDTAGEPSPQSTPVPATSLPLVDKLEHIAEMASDQPE